MKSVLAKVAKAMEMFLLPFGPWGLMAIAFLDSAFIPLPHAIDLYLMGLCIAQPHRLVLYSLSATVGSVAGCLILYFISRAAGHAAAEKKIGKERMERIRAWFERHEFLTVMVPAIMPPPTPFKAFIITAGLSEVHLGKFILALVLGRTIRYMAEGWLAIRYGQQVWEFALKHGPLGFGVFAVCVLMAILGIFLRKRRVAKPVPAEIAVQPSTSLETDEA